MFNFSQRHEDLLLRQWNVDPATLRHLEPPKLVPLAYTPEKILTNLAAGSASVITASRTTLTVSLTSSDATSSEAPSIKATPIEIESLLREFKEGKIATRPIALHGMFFSSVLLFEGWWDRQRGAAPVWQTSNHDAKKGTVVNNIRNWLNSGFEQWGPSWDLTSSNRDSTDLYGQLGYGDEANSIPVIIAPNKAKHLRDQMNGELVIPADVRGLICHRDDIGRYFTSSTATVLKRLDRAPARVDHFVIVLDDDNGHSIERHGSSDMYSAYLWQCLARAEDKQRAEDGALTLDEVIFLWEHTNLSDHDSIRFNFDALQHKKQYIEARLGPMSVLHQSYDVGDIVGTKTDVVLPNSDLKELFARARRRLIGP